MAVRPISRDATETCIPKRGGAVREWLCYLRRPATAGAWAPCGWRSEAAAIQIYHASRGIMMPA